MEESILKHGINSKCKTFVNGEWWDAQIVAINIYTKTVGVIIEIDNSYLPSRRYDQIRFEKQ